MQRAQPPASVSHICESKTGLLGHLTTPRNVLSHGVEKQQTVAQAIQTPLGQAQLLGQPSKKEDPGVT